ncbi:fumarate reductase subunit FrdD [Mycolicibacterium neworleansense]|uniref:Fumarate reductase n=1 Tax=Mycolicibacterium neworleansense TaxID=146018 RepID=A0A0H5RXT2_9MYCO|nr:fumarate reductase subunit FrdD [Mycolicibacterium neworleansense]MCV7362696.1 fumarate reductase subunit D [Mycolicibacterium neworleansense]CRZ18666.1 fumarate reductase [Mycolicibacterium neworleansense]
MSATTRRTPEPYFWLLFSAGGMVSALTLPVLMLLFGVVFPLGLLDAPDPGQLLAVMRNPLTRIVLAGIFVLGLFHWAHRARFMVEHGLKLGRFDWAIAVCAYGTAALCSIAAVWVLLTV